MKERKNKNIKELRKIRKVIIQFLIFWKLTFREKMKIYYKKISLNKLWELIKQDIKELNNYLQGKKIYKKRKK